jgi:hypothetical protein
MLILVGDNIYDSLRDMACDVVENLVTDYNAPGPWLETKYAGLRILRNTVEQGTVPASQLALGASSRLDLRLRAGKVRTDADTGTGAGRGDLVDGNLWVWTSVNRGMGAAITVRDGFHVIINNWGVVLDDPAAQPTLGTVAGPLTVGLLSGVLDWRGYPDNATFGGSRNWPNAGEAVVGGNHATVVVGMCRPVHDCASNTAFPESCRIAPATDGRSDRNLAVIEQREDPTRPTDYATPVARADFSKVPHRLMPFEVGAAGWAAGYYR